MVSAFRLIMPFSADMVFLPVHLNPDISVCPRESNLTLDASFHLFGWLCRVCICTFNIFMLTLCYLFGSLAQLWRLILRYFQFFSTLTTRSWRTKSFCNAWSHAAELFFSPRQCVVYAPPGPPVVVQLTSIIVGQGGWRFACSGSRGQLQGSRFGKGREGAVAHLILLILSGQRRVGVGGCSLHQGQLFGGC